MKKKNGFMNFSILKTFFLANMKTKLLVRTTPDKVLKKIQLKKLQKNTFSFSPDPIYILNKNDNIEISGRTNHLTNILRYQLYYFSKDNTKISRNAKGLTPYLFKTAHLVTL